MPQLGSTEDLQQVTLGNFQYSAAKINTLGATEYTLATIASDVSGSVAGFKTELEIALKASVDMCLLSPRVDNLMLRHLQFASAVEESLGFTLFSKIDTARFDNCLKVGGATALNDAVLNAVTATANYAENLVKADFNVNGLVVVITDGCNWNEFATVQQVKDSIIAARKAENLESLTVIVVGVNIDPSVDATLKKWIADIGLDINTDYIALKDASKKTLAKLAKFISQSISASSQALGTGGASKQLTSGSLQQSLTI